MRVVVKLVHRKPFMLQRAIFLLWTSMPFQYAYMACHFFYWRMYVDSDSFV